MLNWILSQFKRQSAEDLERARELVKAAERGGAHVNLAKARDLARALVQAGQIKEADADLGSKIEDLMVVFENLLNLSDRDIQALMREISSETLMMALRGADEAVRNKIMGNMSRRAAELLRDDLENMPPVKLSDVEAAQKDIMSTAKRLAEAGEITLGTKGDQLV